MTREHDEERVPEEELAIDFEPEEELGSISALKAKLQKLKDELEAVKKERQEYLDGWQRCKADNVNARRDALLAAERGAERIKEHVLGEILPVVDSFDAAIQHEAWQKQDATWRSGIEGIRMQLLSALEVAGASHFGKIGDNFDPAIHNALEEVDGGTGNTVAEVVRRGWKLKDHVIRPAHVKVYRAS